MAHVYGSQANDSRQGLAGPTFLRMLFYVPFVMITSAWAITAAAETVPEADLLVISEIHDTVWGDQSWDMPIASRETAAKVFDSVLSRVESPAAAALVWELRADFFSRHWRSPRVDASIPRHLRPLPKERPCSKCGSGTDRSASGDGRFRRHAGSSQGTAFPH